MIITPRPIYRVLVADDERSVLEAYRTVFGEIDASSSRDQLADLEGELFNAPAPSESIPHFTPVTSPLWPKDLTLFEKAATLSSLIQSVVFALAELDTKARAEDATNMAPQIFKMIFVVMVPPFDNDITA